MGDARVSYPRFRREGGERPIELTDDDLAILRHVHRHRFIRANDLHRLIEHRSADKLSRRLTWLFRAGYLDRPPAQIDRYGDGGSRSMVYGLGSAGARTLKERLGLPIGPTDWRARNRSYTRENLDHTLSVTQFLVDLEVACRMRADVSVIPFEEILAGAPEATRAAPRPGRWKVPVRWEDRSGVVDVAPDAIFGLRAQKPDGSSARSFVFLEIDRGSMTIVPAKQVRESDAFLHRATILRKILTYAQSHQQQIHRKHLAVPIARVVTLTTSRVRAEAMRDATARFVVRPGRLPPGLFLFGVLGSEDPLRASLETADGTPVSLTG